MSVHVASVGMTRYGKRPEGLIDLAAEAASAALEGVGRRPIDFLVAGSMFAYGPHGPEALLPRLAGRIGLESGSGLRVDSASGTGGMAFYAAVLALESGRFDRALVIAAEKMTDRSTAVITRALAASLHPSEVAEGATMPALAAIVTQRYLQRFDRSPAICDAATVHARAMAVNNPYAQFQKPVSAEEVARDRLVSTPLRLLHCSAISDGATALVLERGTEPATVLGLGQGFESLRIVDRDDLTTFAGTRVAAKRAYRERQGHAEGDSDRGSARRLLAVRVHPHGGSRSLRGRRGPSRVRKRRGSSGRTDPGESERRGHRSRSPGRRRRGWPR